MIIHCLILIIVVMGMAIGSILIKNYLHKKEMWKQEELRKKQKPINSQRIKRLIERRMRISGSIIHAKLMIKRGYHPEAFERYLKGYYEQQAKLIKQERNHEKYNQKKH